MTGVPATAPAGRKSRRWVLLLALLPVAAVLLYALYLFAALHYDYSSGDRVGYIQKFSKRGWIFSTWEGELAMVTMPGTAAEIFPFTVRDALVVQAINENLGKHVAITYEQHKGLPGLFGDTEYFIVKVRRVGD
jgi:hypothetical protein